MISGAYELKQINSALHEKTRRREENSARRKRKKKLEGREDGESVSLEDLKTKMADFAKERDWDQFHSPRTVSYTHLTLPTKRIV